MTRHLAVASVAAALLAACSPIGRARPVPLYPNARQPRPPQSLAQLEGPIQAVDGVGVESLGTVFQLLPGCHVVVLRRKIGAGSELGAWSADLGAITYAFRMKPGQFYSIETETTFGSAGHGTLRILAYERNGDGAVTGTVRPIRSRAEVGACEAWAEAQGYGPFQPGSNWADEAPEGNASASFAR